MIRLLFKVGILPIAVLSVMSVSSCGELFEEDEDRRNIIMDTAPKKEFVTLRSGVVVEKDGDQYIYLGDIVLSEYQLDLLDRTGSIFSEESFSTDKAQGLPVSPITGFVAKRI